MALTRIVRGRIIVGILAALVTAATVTGCTAVDTLATIADPDSSHSAGVNTPVVELSVGSCFDDRTGVDVDTGSSADLGAEPPTVDVVPCAVAHDWEVYYLFGVDDDQFPGDDLVHALAEETCGTQFASFVGVDAATSELGFSYFTPTEGSWTGLMVPTVQCWVGDMNGPIAGSLAGALR